MPWSRNKIILQQIKETSFLNTVKDNFKIKRLQLQTESRFLQYSQSWDAALHSLSQKSIQHLQINYYTLFKILSDILSMFSGLFLQYNRDWFFP